MYLKYNGECIYIYKNLHLEFIYKLFRVFKYFTLTEQQKTRNMITAWGKYTFPGSLFLSYNSYNSMLCHKTYKMCIIYTKLSK